MFVKPESRSSCVIYLKQDGCYEYRQWSEGPYQRHNSCHTTNHLKQQIQQVYLRSEDIKLPLIIHPYLYHHTAIRSPRRTAELPDKFERKLLRPVLIAAIGILMRNIKNPVKPTPSNGKRSWTNRCH